MAAYATVDDVQDRMSRTMTEDERKLCETMLEDAGVIIDVYNIAAPTDAKQVVSCRMVIRAMGDGSDSGVIGASSEYTTFTDSMPRVRHSLRMTRARPSNCVSKRSQTTNFVGSSLLPAPIAEMTGTPASFAHWMSRSFAVTVSMASTT